uniref:hypothetical protein n=1 Tax=Notoacmeibacter marinus TaxID=1876515 RepID=UPI001964D965
LILENHPNGTFANLGGILVRRLAHDAPSYSGVGASDKPRAVHNLVSEKPAAGQINLRNVNG